MVEGEEEDQNEDGWTVVRDLKRAGAEIGREQLKIGLDGEDSWREGRTTK